MEKIHELVAKGRGLLDKIYSSFTASIKFIDRLANWEPLRWLLS